MPSGKSSLTPQQKERILFLHQQGLDIVGIARDVGVQDSRKVGGFIRSAINLGKIPPPPPNGSPLPENPQMSTIPPQPASVPAGPEAAAPPPVQPQASAPPPPQPSPQAHYAASPQQPHYAPPVQPQPPPSDGFTGWRQAAGYSGGFTHPSQTIRYQVERKEPPESAGVMGQHTAPFSDHELGRLYGEGLYRVLRFDPGKAIPYETEVRISPAYGQARWPKRDQPDPRGDRPGYWRAPWRQYEQHGDEERERPPYRPSYERPQGLYEFSRHAPPAESSMAAEAIKQMGAAHERTIEQLEKSRTTGPEGFMTKFFGEQQSNWERRMDEQRRLDEERRRDDQAKWDRRQQEDREAAVRREQEEQKRHERELERMKTESSNRLKELEAAAKERELREKTDREAREKLAADERKFLLELEDRKMKLLQEQHRIEKERIEERARKSEEELKALHAKTAEQMKDLQDVTQSRIDESDEKMEKELARQRAHQDEMHKLREKSLDKEYDLNQQILEIKKESISSAASSEIFQTINTVIKEFSKGLEKIVDLKKLEAMTPEAQAAAVASGKIDGNVLGEPKKGQEAPAAEQAQKPAAQAQAAQAAQAPGRNGNGAAAAEAPKQGEAQMEQVIQEMLDRPFFRQVIREWCVHVRTGQDPTTFANMYLEWMRDPMDHEGRKACSMFANFMKPREWPEMLKIIAPKLEKETLGVFQTAAATDFYDGFRAMVVEQIRDYWEQFLAARKAQRAAATAAGAEPAEEPPVEEGAAQNPKK